MGHQTKYHQIADDPEEQMFNIVEIGSDGLVHDEWCIRTCTTATDICTCSLFGYPHPITEPIADQAPANVA